MESRKLGNKTKIIKLMSNVGNYGLIILTKPKSSVIIHKENEEEEDSNEPVNDAILENPSKEYFG